MEVLVMKSYELQPTPENLLDTLADNIIDRNKFINKFISLLNCIEDCCSISLDGKWGSGKTFFVKQVKMVLDALNDSINIDDERREKIKNIYSSFSRQDDDIELKPMVSIYYDAWINDNDDDPILSIIYEIVKNTTNYNDFHKDQNIFTLVSKIFEFFTGKKIEILTNALHKENPLEAIKNEKDIHNLIEEFLKSLLTEHGERLVIFIDELDRCKPIYAVRLLERIKHYFNDNRITFVFSTNLMELQHTIKQYYGNNFNGSKYLDRFFDLYVSLPTINPNLFYKSKKFGNYNNESYIYDIVCNSVIKTYHFEMREIEKYIRLIKIAAYKTSHNLRNISYYDDRAMFFCTLFLLPIMLGLKIYNYSLYNEFISGNNVNPLLDVISSCGTSIVLKYIYTRDEYSNAVDNPDNEDIIKRLKLIYANIFDKNDNYMAYTENEIMTFSQSGKDLFLSLDTLLSDISDYDYD